MRVFRRFCTALIVMLALASCEGEGRPFYPSIVTLASDSDAVYDTSLCEAAFALGAILSDPAPLQDVTGTYAAFDRDNERLRLIAYGNNADDQTQALILTLTGSGDFVDDSDTPVIDDGELGTITAGTMTLVWGTASNAVSDGVPVLPEVSTFSDPMAIAVDLEFSTTDLVIARGAFEPLFALNGTITIEDADCTSLEDDENDDLDYEIEVTNVLAYEDALD